MFLKNLKICGITTREAALFCAEAGAGALGAVFYKKSPRHVTPQQARTLFEDLPSRVARVGVFANLPADEMVALAREAKLDTVQMHGNESPSDMAAVEQAGFRVVKVLTVTGENLLAAARALPASVGILVECGRGFLPGGNGMAWRWEEAAPLAELRAFALAGGLTPRNFLDAVRLSRASAWDVSSGVEDAPGVKGHDKIQALVNQALKCNNLSAPSFWKG